MIVLDASAAVEWLLQTSKAEAIDDHLFGSSPDTKTWHAPHLLDIEVAQVLRRHVAARIMTAERGREALQDLMDLPLVRYPHDFLLPRIWELRQNLTAYDATYIALSEVLGVPLLTCDRRLADAPGHSAQVTVV